MPEDEEDGADAPNESEESDDEAFDNYIASTMVANDMD